MQNYGKTMTFTNSTTNIIFHLRKDIVWFIPTFQVGSSASKRIIFGHQMQIIHTLTQKSEPSAYLNPFSQHPISRFLKTLTSKEQLVSKMLEANVVSI